MIRQKAKNFDLNTYLSPWKRFNIYLMEILVPKKRVIMVSNQDILLYLKELERREK